MGSPSPAAVRSAGVRTYSWGGQARASRLLELSGQGARQKVGQASFAATRSVGGQLKYITFCPGQGLVIDEICLVSNLIDDVKALLDVERNRDVHCRSKDGSILQGVVRIIAASHAQEAFWPPRSQHISHVDAIGRRIVRAPVVRNLRLSAGGGTAHPSAAGRRGLAGGPPRGCGPAGLTRRA